MLRAYAAILASAPVRRWIDLRARAARWLFGTPTTVLEVLNASLLLVWAGAVLDDRLIALPFYSTAFKLYTSTWANEMISAVFFIAFLYAIVGLRRSGGRYDVLSGYALQLSSLLWVIVAANFLGAYPPLNTEVLAYAGLAMMCWVSGCHLWTRGKHVRRAETRSAGE